ncbi:MAG: prepilin-type N-terminal cleavage/methylation domain-containing protein [Candidatus Eisenbacteria bacterium]|uniref:Prepilin-type N-terminal cleavage/methylation domain-containing protein n=1 Tax=Eiseniibacteriota bacterium TaxID=2212470 RepID=A0A933SHM8_UNCEI|nr:prepilin-type N-terminal cleavage/methylation domain-containing protein [Candidatus Eisenbacteria bacterium]
MHHHRTSARRERGMSLVEVLVALVILSVGVLAVARLFPAGTRAQAQDHLTTSANDYAQEKIEQLTGMHWSDSTLSVGRHPAGSATETLGSGRWHRFYTVTAMNAPLDNLKRVDVTVTYSGAGKSSASSVVATTYVRR